MGGGWGRGLEPRFNKLARRVVAQLLGGQLEADQMFVGRARHCGANDGIAERVDRGVDVARLALLGQLGANLRGQPVEARLMRITACARPLPRRLRRGN